MGILVKQVHYLETLVIWSQHRFQQTYIYNDMKLISICNFM